MTRRRDWFVPLRTTPQPRRAVVCFPAAAAGTSAFSGWRENLSIDHDLWAVRAPGREARLAESPVADIDELMAGLLAQTDRLPACDWVFFGHCLGALVAYELCQRIAEMQQRLPSYLVVSAQPSPKLAAAKDGPPVADLPPDALVAYLADIGIAWPDSLAHQRLLQSMLPTIRADLQLAECYLDPMDRPRLPIPILAVGADHDALAPRETLAAWADCTSASFDLRVLPGGHGFLDEHRADVVAAIEDIAVERPRR
jgi:surfactin synthase thioesterase subunit